MGEGHVGLVFLSPCRPKLEAFLSLQLKIVRSSSMDDAESDKTHILFLLMYASSTSNFSELLLFCYT